MANSKFIPNLKNQQVKSGVTFGVIVGIVLGGLIEVFAPDNFKPSMLIEKVKLMFNKQG